ncbi:GNAT family N-acetyltransferase [Aequorivita sp. SDUM287046]|uniref:GNAT family N-acetyltransferase n=1 Tax=Aequorivita aurantiaca TaxID=3053356 RepID=A0ABT8DJW3_9FLAO|nr:GNAT family N-acetyltransferase [Aequorivita aurantiaca]MDN3724195.1 GNAT family N-acetyltransferase [Aequorivita aurantiaca]
MKIFERERLVIKSLESVDKRYFAELFTDPKILELIPQKAFTENQVIERFHKNLNLKVSDLSNQKCDCGIFEKGNAAMIGLALFLINEHGEQELGYRFRSEYWGKGYGTETTKEMLEYYFQHLRVNKVIADVNLVNTGSVKILDKFMKLVSEYYNENDNCTDRRYELERKNWLENF